MMIRLLVILGVMICSRPALSESAISGPGANSCAVFLDLHMRDPTSYDLLFFVWAQGFMSGMNTVALKIKGEVIDLQPEAYPPEQQMTFLRDFCQVHPLRSYSEAVFELMTELGKSSSDQDR